MGVLYGKYSVCVHLESSPVLSMECSVGPPTTSSLADLE